jgi:hypothetical protein
VRSGATLNFRLCDTRGLEESQGLDVMECNYLLDGNIPNYYQVTNKIMNDILLDFNNCLTVVYTCNQNCKIERKELLKHLYISLKCLPGPKIVVY